MPLSYEWQRRLARWKSVMLGPFGGGEGPRQPRPQICPACGSLVGINTTRCHVCGTSLRFSLAALSKKFSGVFGEHVAPVTTALLVANFIMLGVSWLSYAAIGKGGGLTILWGLSGVPQYRLGASFGPSIFYGHEWWRLVTAQFLHGGLIHIGFNMMALMQIGPAVEEVYGSPRYLFLYIVTGAFGYVLSAWTGHFSLGASAGLLGLVGVMLAITTQTRRRADARIALPLDQRDCHFVRTGLYRFHVHGQLGARRRIGRGIRLGKTVRGQVARNGGRAATRLRDGMACGAGDCGQFRIDDYALPRSFAWRIRTIVSRGGREVRYSTVRNKAPGVDPHSIVVVSLHSPKEKVWGELLDINPSGVTLRGIDLNSFDHFIRQINEPDGERIGLPTVFFPMNRVERVSLDEPSGAIPSMNELFARKIGRTLTDYLSQFA